MTNEQDVPMTPQQLRVISELRFYIDAKVPWPAIKQWLENLSIVERQIVIDYVQCQVEKAIKVLGPVVEAFREMGEGFTNLERAVTDFDVAAEIAKFRSMEGGKSDDE